MTRKHGMRRDSRMTALILGSALAAGIALAMTTMIAWLILGLPAHAFDPLKMPQFFWYYRHDPQVLRAMTGGAMAGCTLFLVLIYLLWTRSFPPRRATRATRGVELRHTFFRSPSEIIFGTHAENFLTAGDRYSPTLGVLPSARRFLIAIRSVPTGEGSVVVIDMTRVRDQAAGPLLCSCGASAAACGQHVFDTKRSPSAVQSASPAGSVR